MNVTFCCSFLLFLSFFPSTIFPAAEFSHGETNEEELHQVNKLDLSKPVQLLHKRRKSETQGLPNNAHPT